MTELKNCQLISGADIVNVDVVIAIGGGSVLDTGKAAKMLIPNGGLCIDSIAEIKGLYPFEKAGLPLIAIPTTSGTGSEVTPCSVVTDTARNRKVMVADFDKMFVEQTILDPELVQGLPAAITAACRMDVLSHATESYLSPFATPFTDAFNLYAIGLCRKSLPNAVHNGSDLDARVDMMIASTIAGAGVGNSNAHLGHGMAHAMGACWHLPHGIGCALALPYMFEHVMNTSQKEPDRLLMHLVVLSHQMLRLLILKIFWWKQSEHLIKKSASHRQVR